MIAAGFHDEDPISSRGIKTALKAAAAAAKHWRSGDRILVTCYAGMNRSALVAALTVLQVCPTVSAADIIKRIRTRRRVPGHLQGHVAHALFNQAFVRVIEEAGRQRDLNVAR
jgi:protein-tyrosine phosphatase